MRRTQPEAESNLIRAERAANRAVPHLWATLGDEADPEGRRPARELHAEPGVGGRSGYGLDQIMTEAAAIIRDAEQQAERILAEAEREAQCDRERVWEDALAAARDELTGDHAGDADVLMAAQALLAAEAELRQLLAHAVADMEASLVEFGFELAKKIIDQELETRPELVVDGVREAVTRVADAEVTVRLNPADMPLVQHALVELQGSRSGGLLEFEEDPRIERGGCVVVSESGTVDSQPRTKLQQLRSLSEG